MVFISKALLLYSLLALVSTLARAHHWTVSALPPSLQAPNEASMVLLPLREVRIPKATEQFFDGWLADLEAQIAEPSADWHRLTRDLLFQIYYPGVRDYEGMLQDPNTPEATRVALLSLDPRNITLEPEYYAE